MTGDFTHMCEGQIDMTSTWMLCQLKKYKSRDATNRTASRTEEEEKKHLSNV
jgi:hypothetical protein